MEKPQVSRHGARREDRFGNVREAGRRGAQARDQNWHARVSLHREELEKQASEAIAQLGEALEAIVRQLDRHGEIVEIGPDTANRLRAAQMILDRTGPGPSQRTNVSVEAGERFVALMRELDQPEVK